MLERIVLALLEHIPLIFTVLLTTLGWIITYKIAISNFKKQFKKDEYYKIKESFYKINDMFFQFYDCVYIFINETVKKYNESKEFPEHDLNVFSSNKMLKIECIFNLINIEFPEIKINLNEYKNKSIKIEMFYSKLKNIKNSSNNIDNYINAVGEFSKTINELTLISNSILLQMNEKIKEYANKF